MEPHPHLKQRFLAMPWLLRILVAASIGIGVVFCLLPLVPGSSFDLGERELSYEELWQTRVAFAVFAVGVLMLVVGVAVFRRSKWVRPALVVLPVLQVLPFLVVHWVSEAPSPLSSPASFAASAAAWSVFAAVYLFGMRGGREHFCDAA